MMRKDQISRQDAEDIIKFDREMQVKRRKRIEDIISAVTQYKTDVSETDYTEDEVMKMMGLQIISNTLSLELARYYTIRNIKSLQKQFMTSNL